MATAGDERTAPQPRARPRPPDTVMRLERMGAAFPTRLSFMRSLVRRMNRDNWRIQAAVFDLDDGGFGQAVYTARTPERCYSLVTFSRPLDDEQRTDRVIAEAWDTTYVLFDGEPGPADIRRLADNAPKQEAGRYTADDLVLSRANKSVRLFEHVCDSLAQGRQPDIGRMAEAGYLMRTTAVYGNGKFGVSDRGKIAGRPELSGPFQAELLTVYLIRCFTLDHVEHVARRRSPGTAVPLRRDLKRYLGIGNATGLGMAPFLVGHPVLIHNWMAARETALARVRSVPELSVGQKQRFRTLLDRCRRHAGEWRVADTLQQARINALEDELRHIEAWCAGGALEAVYPWDALYQRAEYGMSIETQECLLSLMLEMHPELVDELENGMSADILAIIDPSRSIGELREVLETLYAWALQLDFSQPRSQRYFWYMSEDKLEPRLGERAGEAGADREMPLAVARDVQALYHRIEDMDHAQPVADLLLEHPGFRHVVRRVQTVAAYPYGEIRDNLIGTECRPIDLLRCKLAFFGASKFDPKSDRWTRITLYQGAPLADELGEPDADDWCFPTAPAN
jgi:hypothetical protein